MIKSYSPAVPSVDYERRLQDDKLLNLTGTPKVNMLEGIYEANCFRSKVKGKRPYTWHMVNNIHQHWRLR